MIHVEKQPEGMTHTERQEEINATPLPESVLRLKGKARTEATKYWLAHIERLRLIYKPFPPCRRIGTGSAMPWAGTMVGDTFYGRNNKQFRPAGMTGGFGDDGVLTSYYEREAELHDIAAVA